MSWTLCTSGAAIIKAGVHANSTITNYGTNKTALDKWSDEAEGRICSEGHSNFITGITGEFNEISGALSAACSSLIAMNIISYDPTGYLSREADMLMNMNDETYSKAMVVLKDKKMQRLSN